MSIKAKEGLVVRYIGDEDKMEYTINEIDIVYQIDDYFHYALIVPVGEDPETPNKWGNLPGYWTSVEHLETKSNGQWIELIG